MLFIEAYILLLFGGSAKFKICYGTLTFLVNIGPYGVGNFNATPPTVFIQSQPNVMRPLLWRNAGYYLRFKKCNIEILKYAISWKRLAVERNGQKLGTRASMYCTCRVPFMSDSVSSFWGHSVHFAKFPTSIFLKGTPPVFIQFLPNFMKGMVIRREFNLTATSWWSAKLKQNMALC